MLCNSLVAYGQLCTLQANQARLCGGIDAKTLERLGDLLLVEDMQVALALLESVYRLTLITEVAERVSTLHGCIRTLVCRLGFHADQFPDRVVEEGKNIHGYVPWLPVTRDQGCVPNIEPCSN